MPISFTPKQRAQTLAAVKRLIRVSQRPTTSHRLRMQCADNWDNWLLLKPLIEALEADEERACRAATFRVLRRVIPYTLSERSSP